MKANAERIEKNTVQLEIEVETERFSQAMDKAYRKLVKNVSVPGFRKGKTPRQIFERFVGREAIHEEAMDILVPEVYVKAVQDTGIEPIDRPNVEVVQAEEGKPVLLKVTVQVKPEVKLGQYKELEVIKSPVLVAEDEVEKALERLQNRYAKLLTLEEGAVEKGDTAVIDFLGKVGGVAFKGGEGKDFPLEIGSSSFVPGFEDQLVGMSLGETRDITVSFPADYKLEELAGQESTFTVTVNEIKRKEVAALDDEFAKDVSGFDTLEELRGDIRNKLMQTAQERADYQFKLEAVDKAVDNAELEIPDAMIEHELDEMVGKMENHLASQGLPLENYLKYANTTLDVLRENMRPDAERAAKTSLVLEAIARTENIEATEEDLKEEAVKMAAIYKQDVEKLNVMLQEEGSRSLVAEGIVREKAVKLIVDCTNEVEDTNGQAPE